jgi:hypothetical protein
MARCRRIVAGGASSFSGFASWIGPTQLVNGYDRFDGHQALNIILESSTEIAPVSDLQKAFAYWSVFRMYPNALAHADYAKCLERASSRDPATVSIA